VQRQIGTFWKVLPEQPVLGELLFLLRYQKLIYCRFHRQTLLPVGMKDIVYLPFDRLTTLAKLPPPSGAPKTIATSPTLKQQQIIHGRSPKSPRGAVSCPEITVAGIWQLNQ